MNKCKTCCCLLLYAVIFAGVAHPITRHVPSEYPTIQEGINAALDGDTVLVAPMTYTGPNNRALNFLGRQIVVMSEMGPLETIIDCDSVDRGAYFVTGEDSLSVLQGFTIQNGFSLEEEAGGGILCYNSSPTIRDNIITECDGYWGGGIGCLNASPIIDNNSIINNHGERGGGIALLSNSNAVLRNNIIQDNISSGG